MSQWPKAKLWNNSGALGHSFFDKKPQNKQTCWVMLFIRFVVPSMASTCHWNQETILSWGRDSSADSSSSTPQSSHLRWAQVSFLILSPSWQSVRSRASFGLTESSTPTALHSGCSASNFCATFAQVLQTQLVRFKCFTVKMCCGRRRLKVDRLISWQPEKKTPQLKWRNTMVSSRNWISLHQIAHDWHNVKFNSLTL